MTNAPWEDHRVVGNGQAVKDNFSAWFGASKTVDHQGAPLRFFHGTSVEGSTYDARAGTLPRGAFDAFDPGMLGHVTESSDAKSGFWFSTCEQRAWDAANEARAISGSCHSAYVYEVAIKLDRPLVIKSILEMEPQDVARMAKKAKKAGHDGIMFLEGEGNGIDVVVFDVRQVKSINANSGLFVPGSPSLTDASAAAELDLAARARQVAMLACSEKAPAQKRALRV